MVHVHIADVTAARRVGTGPVLKRFLESRLVDVADRIPDEVAAPDGAVAVHRDHRAAAAA